MGEHEISAKGCPTLEAEDDADNACELAHLSECFTGLLTGWAVMGVAGLGAYLLGSEYLSYWLYGFPLGVAVTLSGLRDISGCLLVLWMIMFGARSAHGSLIKGLVARVVSASVCSEIIQLVWIVIMRMRNEPAVLV